MHNTVFAQLTSLLHAMGAVGLPAGAMRALCLAGARRYGLGEAATQLALSTAADCASRYAVVVMCAWLLFACVQVCH